MRISSLGLCLLAPIALAGCGSIQNPTLPVGTKPPSVPYGSGAARRPDDLMAPPVQTRPEGGAEPLQRSQPRGADGFDLPPEG